MQTALKPTECPWSAMGNAEPGSHFCDLSGIEYIVQLTSDHRRYPQMVATPSFKMAA